jgi:hypothetical protein
MLTATRHQFCITASVDSSAFSQVAIVPAQDGTDAYDLLVTFNNNGKEYRYIFEDDATAEKWFYLLSNEDDKAATSWGREFHRALKHGDIEEIEV